MGKYFNTKLYLSKYGSKANTIANKLTSLVTSKYFLPTVSVAGIGSYLAARVAGKPGREKLKNNIESRLSTLPLVNLKASSVKVKPGILNPLTKKIEMDLKKNVNENLSSKNENMFGRGTIDLHISENPFDRAVWIDSIYLKKKYQGKGLGKAVVALTEDIAKDYNRKKIKVIADEAGKYFWSRVPGMEPFSSDRRPLKSRYKDWAKAKGIPVKEINSIKDYPKEFLLGDASGDPITGFITMQKKVAEATPVYKKVRHSPTTQAIISLGEEWLTRKPPKGVIKEVKKTTFNKVAKNTLANHVLQLAAKGYKNRDISKKLNLTKREVSAIIKNKNLGVHNRQSVLTNRKLYKSMSGLSHPGELSARLTARSGGTSALSRFK